MSVVNLKKQLKVTHSLNLGATMSEQPLGRNVLCWCGSGKKYKKCHLDADKQAETDNRPLDPRAREYWEIQKSILPSPPALPTGPRR
jgi:hypothetical protein